MAYENLINNEELDGIFNICIPNPITNKKLTKVLAQTLNRPAFLPVPAIILKLIFGDEACILTSGQYVYPKCLLKNNFKFVFDTIESSLQDLLK